MRPHGIDNQQNDRYDKVAGNTEKVIYQSAKQFTHVNLPKEDKWRRNRTG